MSVEPTRKEATNIKFVYGKPEDVRPVYVNGAYGGISPRGELIVNFFFERPDLPKEEKMPLIEGKPQVEHTERTFPIDHTPDELVLRRDINAILIIPIQEISGIANWMLDKLKASNIIVEKSE
jgi:hypothetical protein